jgi:hypothetical protein
MKLLDAPRRCRLRTLIDCNWCSIC